MKKLVIVALICVNVALVLALFLGRSEPTAKAQAIRGGTDYLLLTAKVNTDTDAVYVLDMAKRKMMGFEFDTTMKRLKPIRARDLANDFPPAKGNK